MSKRVYTKAMEKYGACTCALNYICPIHDRNLRDMCAICGHGKANHELNWLCPNKPVDIDDSLYID